MAMAVYLIIFPAILTSLFALSSPNQPDFDRLLGEWEEPRRQSSETLALILLHLKMDADSALKENIQNLQAKWSLYLKEREELIQEMDDKIQYLQSALSNLKDDSPHADERLKTLEQEVRLLWAASRKNNFDLHTLEAQVQYAEDQLALVTSQAGKMIEVVTEQWFQIQHLEQALEISKIKALEVQRKSSMRCTFLKFINDLPEAHLSRFPGEFGSGFNLASYISQTLEQFKSFFSSAKKYHHEFQAFIKKEMVKNEFTAALANDELVFYLASALLIFPLLSAWMLLPSLLS